MYAKEEMTRQIGAGEMEVATGRTQEQLLPSAQASATVQREEESGWRRTERGWTG